ncbi:sensor histidine kinase [Anaerocolumna sp. AGMB13025]|uniref:sensor histidine kinase n=1 Tax=Anaerocolumna sp. AGMB13025 TaxID=3039116 RepID=UPI00241CD979|nr:sensor histidine kinase [Anaerocolumna sp. AGMB13025]WFR57503.1 sensor histidine kinase [Anaerocolumna sp. AGMB13025]
MIHQDDNMGFMEQLSDALDFLTQNEEQTQKELDQINISIKCLEEELKEINNSLTVINKNNNSNADLFSPSIKIEKDNRISFLIAEKQNIESKMKEAEENFLFFINRKNSLDNLINCFYTMKSNCIEEPGTVNESTTYNISQDMGINVLETQENERKRIARDLHDSTVQNLTNMMHKTELCTRLIDIDPVRAKLELQTMINTIKSTINDMRNIIFGLRPMSLDDLGLIATIERYIRDFKKNHEIDISLRVHNEEKSILPVINLTLFRIVQEASNNAMKHGKANKIVIDLSYDDETIALSISDNGIGFKKDTYMETKANMFSGYGLSMMKERILLLSGDFNIESSENKGTNILVKVPLNHARRTYK